jgi:SprT-like family.
MTMQTVYTTKATTIPTIVSDRLEQTIRKEYVKMHDYLAERYDLPFERVPLVFNGRLTRALGRYIALRDGTPSRIELASKQVAYALYDEEAGMKAILDTLMHELVHHMLHANHLPANDGDKLFEQILAELNVASSGSTADSLKVSDAKLVYYEKRINVHDKSKDENFMLPDTPSYRKDLKYVGWDIVGVSIVRFDD